jgi:hypothetical protein
MKYYPAIHWFCRHKIDAYRPVKTRVHLPAVSEFLYFFKFVFSRHASGTSDVPSKKFISLKWGLGTSDSEGQSLMI